MKTSPQIYVALPVMAESEWLAKCLDCIFLQDNNNFHVVACVNQPDSFWGNENKRYICEDNKLCLDILSKYDTKKITIIDRTTEGNGWTKKSGIGYARKLIMDQIADAAEDNDLILSLDADTTFGKKYFSSVVNCFVSNKNIVALSNPYYHKLVGSEKEDRAILRYEIYMRNYAINLLTINSPYAFTALGSAISLPVSSYKAIGGMTPKNSGEDFYLLQKLKKYGTIKIYNSERVYPAARFSDRVFFGTGPAMIKGNTGDWSSYPIYHYSLFNDISATYKSFQFLFHTNVDTPLSEFLKSQFNEENIWEPLRNNFRNEGNFIRACHEKLDGLRILQYLKQKQDLLGISDEQCLKENTENIFSKIVPLRTGIIIHDFMNASIEELDTLRNYLSSVEEVLQKKTEVL